MILVLVHLGISTLPALTDFGKYFFQTYGYLLRPKAIETSTIIIGKFVFCNNILWLLCVLNHPALLLRGVANKSLIFLLYDV